MPVIAGMRWSTRKSATGSSRCGQLADDLERIGPEPAPMTR